MDGGAAGNELAALDRALAAAEIADETARLAHQQHTGGDVPDIQVGLPETIEAARRNPGEIEARRAEAANAGDFGADGGEDAAPLRHVAMAHEGNAGRDQAFVEAAARRSEEHTSELQSLMSISYATFCMK